MKTIIFIVLNFYVLSVLSLNCPGKACQNGGLFNPENCNCECYPGYYGETCQYLDCNAKDPYKCLSWGEDACIVPQIKSFCPQLCKVCEGPNPPFLPNHKDPHFDKSGTPKKGVIVHLFEWKWTDIASECENFLGPKGYGGVQVSPPNEHALVEEPFRPWWQRYQPVSYKLTSRSGNEDEFKQMVERCNAVGVRIYVDAVINHMSATGGKGSGGSVSDPTNKNYPGVPYTQKDFHSKNCNSPTGGIENYNDTNQVRNCNLLGQPDLDTSSEYVREQISNYMNILINYGIAGFRIDASKHMLPSDLLEIYEKLDDVKEDPFGANKKPFIFHEVIDLGREPIKNTQYTYLGRVTEFKYGMFLSQAVLKKNGQKMADLKNLNEQKNFIASGDSLVFIDNHDNQRGHGAGGDILTYKKTRDYKIANAFMLAWPYGLVKIMSSYDFPLSDDSRGPPSEDDGNTKPALTTPTLTRPDGDCEKGWICEHRWEEIYRMVKFRNIAEDSEVTNWWDKGANQIAFCRKEKAFIAINNEDFAMDVTLQTDLESGDYCDVISGYKDSPSSCTGKKITVKPDKTIDIYIPSYMTSPIIAIHTGSKIMT